MRRLRWLLFTKTEREVIRLALDRRMPSLGPHYAERVNALNAMREELA